MKVIVVGAGIFGVTAALELGRRGHRVTVVDAGSSPHADASSTDLSKAVRLDYGADRFFTELARDVLPMWHDWQTRWSAETGETIYHEDGFLFLTKDPVQPDSFEARSMQLLNELGWPIERLDEGLIRSRYPAFQGYVDGYFNPGDGWAESGRVVAWIVGEMQAAGVELLTNRSFDRFLESSGAITGVATRDGVQHHGDIVVMAVGAWTPFLIPWLGTAADEPFVRCVGQSVFYLEVDDPDPWRAPRMPMFSADISRTGWYGFPATEGVVKVANHGPGRELGPEDPRVVPDADEASLRSFLAESLPGLQHAPIARRRVCPYCDSFDGAFLIDHDPTHPGLVVATGGSGHGFKFAPMLGGIIADVVEGRPNAVAARFAWRQPDAIGREEARHQG